MNYKDGQQIRLCDEISLGGDWIGIVVCVIDDDQYTCDEPREKWGYLGHGLVVTSSKAGYIHYEKPDEEMELIRRSCIT